MDVSAEAREGWKKKKTHIDLHFPVKAIVEKEVVCHADPVGFHGMALAIIVVPYIALERQIVQTR